MKVTAIKTKGYNYVHAKLLTIRRERHKVSDYYGDIFTGKEYNVIGILTVKKKHQFYLIRLEYGAFDFIPKEFFNYKDAVIPKDWISRYLTIYDENDVFLSFPELIARKMIIKGELLYEEKAHNELLEIIHKYYNK